MQLLGWYPDYFFRRGLLPTSMTRLTVRSRTQGRLEFVDVFIGGAMTFARRAVAASWPIEPDVFAKSREFYRRSSVIRAPMPMSEASGGVGF